MNLLDKGLRGVFEWIELINSMDHKILLSPDGISTI